VSAVSDAQKLVDNRLVAANKIIAKIGMGYDKPSADLADRFGNMLNFHLGMERLSASNWIVSTDFTYRFGSDVFGLHEKSPQSGIRIDIGAGLLSHYIRIQDENQAIDQIFGEYEKVYDRLTRGFALTEYIGYQYLSTDGNLNFNIGFEFNQAFTSGVRSVDFTTNTPAQTGRNDFLSGFKVTWLIPLYSAEKGEQIYY